MAKKAPTAIYQLKISLRDARPPIWRRLLVADTTTLAKLHEIIQIAMGWENYHLHQFITDRTFYGKPSTDDWDEVLDERKYTLAQIAPTLRQKFQYEYDFGDGWRHDVLVEKILAPEPKQKYPVCIKGKRACPPENVGGVWGYEEFVAAIQDPAHPEHDSYLDWVGGEFDPEAFALAQINEELGEL